MQIGRPHNSSKCGLVSDVKCKQKQTTCMQHPKHLPKYGGQELPRDVHDRVERHNPSQCAIFAVKPQHVADLKTDAGIELECLLHHGGRNIQSEDICAEAMEIPRHMSRAATHIAE